MGNLAKFTMIETSIDPNGSNSHAIVHDDLLGKETFLKESVVERSTNISGLPITRFVTIGSSFHFLNYFYWKYIYNPLFTWFSWTIFNISYSVEVR